ncbi:MAG: hypothetical protein ACRD29_15440 [Acidimicrobiales bacterium]
MMAARAHVDERRERLEAEAQRRRIRTRVVHDDRRRQRRQDRRAVFRPRPA